jgi:flagellar protein FlaH
METEVTLPEGAPPATEEAAPAPAEDSLSDLRAEASREEAAPPPEEVEEEEAVPRLIAMGVMDIDKKLGGGLPLDTITLVEGDPESGKSVIVQQLAYNAMKDGLKTDVFLAEMSAREFLNQMQSLGMPSMDYYLLRRLSLYQSNLRVDHEKAERLMRRLLQYIEKPGGAELIVVDSITPLLFQFDARYVLSFLATCKELANMGKTILVTLHSYAINESLRFRADSIVDAHLRLKIEELGKQVVRTLEVCKIRGAVKTVGNSVSFSVEPGVGLKSIPISKTKA